MRRASGVLVLCVLVSVAGCADDAPPGPPGDPDDAGVDPPQGDEPFQFVRCDTDGTLPRLFEDRRVYQQDSLALSTVHLTVTDLDALAAVNAGVVDAVVPVVFTDGTFGAGAPAPNATLEIRGAMSRTNLQKNYKIKLNDGTGHWRGQREINLNKHMWDLTRIRNKLSFDIFQTVAHLTSLRTQFVQMYVNGQNYGLYTWIEEADKRFLASHGLDPDGQLYKATLFHFQYVDPAVAADPAQLELLIEAKANRDDAKLLRMIAAVNDPGVPADELVGTYFNRDNLATWLAVNVLVNNIDTLTQNYYLYSPSSCEGWYILPWDYDGAWGFYGQLTVDDRDRWQSGLTNWWPSALFKRFFADPANVQAVDERIAELSQSVLTDDVTAARIAGYHDVVLPHISTQPDLQHLPGVYGDAPASVGIELWEGELTRISSTVSRFLAEYRAVIERPMPVFLNVIFSSPLQFRWDDSFDLQGDPITYDFQISRTPAFAPGDVIVQQLAINDDETYVPSLPAGTYYWRVIIQDHKTVDSWQLPIDHYDPLVIE